MAESPRAIIIGGGIAGLSAAIGLHRIGWQALVLEQSSAFEAVGAGISLWPNALKALEALGIGEAVRALASPKVIPAGMRSERGRWITHTPSLDIAVVHRADLHQTLLGAVPDSWLLAGAQVAEVTADGQVSYRVAGKTQTTTGDLVIGADGIWSLTRSQLWRESSPPEFRGKTAWRGVTRPGEVELEAEGETWGLAGRFGMLQLSGGRVYWFAEALAPQPEISYPDELCEVRSRYGDWHHPIKELLDATDPAAVLHHDIVDLPPLASYHRGRVALVGDAAHAMTPDLGQGACQGLEDVVELCAALAHREPQAALAHYDQVRRPRSQAFARASRRMGELGQVNSRAALRLRLVAAALAPQWLVERSMSKVSEWAVPELT